MLSRSFPPPVKGSVRLGGIGAELCGDPLGAAHRLLRRIQAFAAAAPCSEDCRLQMQGVVLPGREAAGPEGWASGRGGGVEGCPQKACWPTTSPQ